MTSLRSVHVSRIDPNPANIRGDLGDLDELAASIHAQGLIQPLVVTPDPRRPGRYTLIAGHRRLAAARLARLEMVPVTFPAGEITPARMLELMLVENCQRRDLGPIEKAEAMGTLRHRGYNATRIAEATGLTVSTVSYYLSLLDLDQASMERVRNGLVKPADAVAAVRGTRAGNRRRQGLPPRKPSVAAEHFSYRHPLAAAARLTCDLAGHTAPRYGPMPSKHEGKVACGACWEHVIRADATGQLSKPGDGTVITQPMSKAEDRIRRLAEMGPLHDNSGNPADGVLTARQAAERIGVTTREIERYKNDSRYQAALTSRQEAS